MAELAWKDAIIKVLTEAKGAMHYTDIAQAIAAKGFKTKISATPAASIAATISLSFQNEGEKSPFVKVSRGYFSLKDKKLEPILEEEKDEAGFLNAFGMYWKRENVICSTFQRKPRSRVWPNFRENFPLSKKEAVQCLPIILIQPSITF